EVSLDRLSRAARSAWRDGTGRTEFVANDIGRWTAEVRRSGRGEDYLVWRLAPITAADPVAELVQHLDGKVGRALSHAGIAAAIVDPDGLTRADSAGFAQSATGDPLAAMAGRDFVSLLR